MSQYGRISSNYYNPIAKLNTTRTSLRYFVLVYDYSSRILNYCSYLIAENAVQYHIDSFPFNFSLSITKSCKIPTFDTPLEYTDYFLPVIPLDNTVTGNCSLTIEVNQTEYNRDMGSIIPQPFNFDTITSSCTSNLYEGIALDYTPTAPPAALIGLYQQVINHSCGYTMPSNPFHFYSSSEAFNFISITQSCSFSIPFDVPLEYTDYFINTIPIDNTVTGSCTLNVDVNQVDYNKDMGSIIPQPFNFATIDNSCVAIINN